MQIKGSGPMPVSARGGVDAVAETPEEQAFFDRGDALSIERTKAPAPRPVQRGSMLSAGSVLSVQSNAISPLRFDNARFERVMDDVTGSRSTKGNTIVPLFDGVNSFAARNKLIDEAKHSIFLETFIFDSDETGWELARRLAQKADQGLKVAVIYDELGTGRADPKMFDFMRAHGVEVRPYEKTPLNINSRWHEKLLIVDGEHAITGGMNIANEYAWGGTDKKVLSRGSKPANPWRDVDVQVTGPVVRAMALDFLFNWKVLGPEFPEAFQDDVLSRAKPQRRGADARFVERKSNEDQANVTEDAYFYAITAAQKSITIENAYFAPSETLRTALIDAAKRGVHVRVLTNSKATNDVMPQQLVMQHWYDDLVRGGVELHEMNDATLHAKTATFDGVYSIIGSANLNNRSVEHDSEDMILTPDRATAQALEARFETGVAVATRVDEEYLARVSRWTRIWQHGAQVLLGNFT